MPATVTAWPTRVELAPLPCTCEIGVLATSLSRMVPVAGPPTLVTRPLAVAIDSVKVSVPSAVRSPKMLTGTVAVVLPAVMVNAAAFRAR
jgi:hypothetical protein